MSMGKCVIAGCEHYPKPTAIFCVMHWQLITVPERSEFLRSQARAAAALIRGEQGDFNLSRLQFEGVVAAIAARVAERMAIEIRSTEGEQYAAS